MVDAKNVLTLVYNFECSYPYSLWVLMAYGL